MRQRATLVSIPGIPVNDLEAIDVVPGLEDLHRPVRRVIDEDDLVVGIVQSGAGFEQPANHPFLVVSRDMDGDKRVVPKLQLPIAVADRMSASIGAPANDPGETVEALLVLAAFIPVPPGTEECQEEDRRRSQVVLERVGEEERTHAE